jgi:peroxiredoxin
VDPRTFLPPPRIDVSNPPRTGDPAPTLALSDRELRTAVLAFLRHAGCPFAEATARDLVRAANHHPDVQWVAVTHAPQGATDAWCEAVGLQSGVLVLADPDRSLYATWGVGTTSLRHFAGRRSLRGVANLARRGIRNRHPSGSRWQGAATFAIDADGILRLTHFPEHAGDLPDLDAAAAAARGNGAA